MRARGENRRTRSDWMKIERERGISVSASVMTFDHDGLMFNLLDTPGHEDFSEDTYRTLTAADAAVMVLDAAKGIEPQTLKLFEVCRLRDIPIVTFINKMDREAQDPFALLDEIASKLALDPAPLYWPAGLGQPLQGHARPARARRFLPFAKKGPTTSEGHPAPIAFKSNAIVQLPRPRRAGGARGRRRAGAGGLQAVRPAVLPGRPHDAGVLRLGAAPFRRRRAAGGPGRLRAAAQGRRRRVQGGRGDPRRAGRCARSPASSSRSRPTWTPTTATASPSCGLTSGRVPARHEAEGAEHRPAAVSVNAPIMFFASDRELAEEAFAGDVIGIPNHGVLRVGDSLSESGTLRFAGLPNFAPEILQRVRVKDPLKAKHLKKALEGLAEEGVTQLFRPTHRRRLHRRRGGPAAVRGDGRPAGERIPARRASSRPSPYAEARWLAGDKADLEDFAGKHRTAMAEDIDDQPVFLAKSAWEIGYVSERYPKVRFERSKERA